MSHFLTHTSPSLDLHPHPTFLFYFLMSSQERLKCAFSRAPWVLNKSMCSWKSCLLLCTSFLYLFTPLIFLKARNHSVTNYIWAYVLAKKTDIRQIVTAKYNEWHERGSSGVLWGHRAGSQPHLGG